jgi:hypothetical protein
VAQTRGSSYRDFFTLPGFTVACMPTRCCGATQSHSSLWPVCPFAVRVPLRATLHRGLFAHSLLGCHSATLHRGLYAHSLLGCHSATPTVACMPIAVVVPLRATLHCGLFAHSLLGCHSEPLFMWHVCPPAVGVPLSHSHCGSGAAVRPCNTGVRSRRE